MLDMGFNAVRILSKTKTSFSQTLSSLARRTTQKKFNQDHLTRNGQSVSARFTIEARHPVLPFL